MFLYQDTKESNDKNNYFYKTQKEWLKSTNHSVRSKDYISTHFYQLLTDKFQDKTANENEKNLFSIGCDILIRHCMTSRKFIQYNDEDKNEFYSYAIFRIFNFGLKTYNKERGNSFVYMTSCINNGIKQVIKDNVKQQNLSNLILEKNGIEGYITNTNERMINDIEFEYLPTKTEQFNILIPLIIVDLKKKYKIQKIKILVEDNVPRFRRKYETFKYFIKVGDTGIVIEYIDVYRVNDETTRKNYFRKRLEFARARGYQTFFVFSDIYNNENVDDEIIFKRLDDMVEKLKNNNMTPSFGYASSLKNEMVYDPMLCYIPTNMFLSKKLTPQIWYFLDTKREKRRLIANQSKEHYNELKKENNDYTRVWDCGKLEF